VLVGIGGGGGRGRWLEFVGFEWYRRGCSGGRGLSLCGDDRSTEKSPQEDSSTPGKPLPIPLNYPQESTGGEDTDTCNNGYLTQGSHRYAVFFSVTLSVPNLEILGVYGEVRGPSHFFRLLLGIL
jgi:hypothetical protein